MEKKQYERPTIIRHVSGLANKFGRAQAMQTCSRIGGVAVSELVKKFGSPLFVFDEKTVRRVYRDTFKAFTVRYPKVQFAWSYKTNYLDAITMIYHQEGSWAEVVSEYEYEMARRNGIPGEKIIYNGPYKPVESLRTAVEDGARIHIDHYDELAALEKIAEESGKVIDVAIRINMDTGIYPKWDRFGFNLDNGEARNAIRRIHAGGKMRLTGLHSHIGTFITQTFAYRNEASRLAAFAREIEKDTGFQIEYIDVGGGFASKNTLHSQYSPGRETNPPVEEYADAITSALLGAGFQPDRLPTLILETGRHLIDDAGYMITTVVGNKRLANGTRTLIIDAGVNILFTAFWYKLEMMPEKEKSGIFEETVVYGPLCMNIDVVRPSIRMPAMNPGDRLVLHPVGAYNVTQWMQFIRMRPAVALVTASGEAELIRESEDLDYLKTKERVPRHLLKL